MTMTWQSRVPLIVTTINIHLWFSRITLTPRRKLENTRDRLQKSDYQQIYITLITYFIFSYLLISTEGNYMCDYCNTTEN